MEEEMIKRVVVYLCDEVDPPQPPSPDDYIVGSWRAVVFFNDRPPEEGVFVVGFDLADPPRPGGALYFGFVHGGGFTPVDPEKVEVVARCD